jgi:hypothetical protein
MVSSLTGWLSVAAHDLDRHREARTNTWPELTTRLPQWRAWIDAVPAPELRRAGLTPARARLLLSHPSAFAMASMSEVSELASLLDEPKRSALMTGVLSAARSVEVGPGAAAAAPRTLDSAAWSALARASAFQGWDELTMASLIEVYFDAEVGSSSPETGVSVRSDLSLPSAWVDLYRDLVGFRASATKAGALADGILTMPILNNGDD